MPVQPSRKTPPPATPAHLAVMYSDGPPGTVHLAVHVYRAEYLRRQDGKRDARTSQCLH